MPMPPSMMLLPIFDYFLMRAFTIIFRFATAAFHYRICR